MDGLAVDGADRQVQVLRDVFAGTDFRALHDGQDLIGRGRKAQFPFVLVSKILAEDQVVQHAILVGVLGLERVFANVFVDLASASAGARAELDDVALDQLGGLVRALQVGHRAAVGVRVVADEIACNRNANGRTHTRATTCAHADGGRDDGGLNAAARFGRDTDIATGDHRCVGQTGIHITQNDVEGRSTSATDTHACAAADAGGHRRRQ